jgi:maltose O-acetyltransferase
VEIPRLEDFSGLVTDDDPRTHKERLLAGDPFSGIDHELLSDQRRAAHLTAEYARALDGDGYMAARAILQELFGACELGFIKPPFTVNYGYPTRIGQGGFINSGAVFLDDGGITIGANILIGPNVQLLTAGHPILAAERGRGITVTKPIVIGDSVWIGGGAIVLGGVTIGDRSVVGAGSVVTKDVAPDTVVAGNPARVVRELDNA